MTEPLAPGNARVKTARRLSRRSGPHGRSERRLFLAEGWKAIEAAQPHVVEVYATAEAAQRYADVLAGHDVIVVQERALESLADSVTPQGLVAVCRFFDRPLAELVGSSRLLAICADIRDPGNAGTVIRTADAAGADAVVLTGESVDLYNPKTLRASVGSAFRLPLCIEPDTATAIDVVRRAGLQILATAGSGERDLYDDGLALDRPTAWLFGNEAHGLDAAMAARADERVRIPIYGGAESLNLATAAALCLYESARARRD